MLFDPTLFPGGPAYFSTGGTLFQAQDDSWKISDESTTFDTPTNLYGSIGKRNDATMHGLAFKPIATAANLAALLAACIPYRKSMEGQTIYPANDVTGVVQTKLGGATNTGQSVTYAKVAVVEMAKLMCGPNLELFGQTKWRALVKSGAFGTAAGDFYTLADSAYIKPPQNSATRLYDTYTLAIGTNPVAPFASVIVDKTGIEVSPTVKLELIDPSLYGPTQYKIDEVGLEISFRPVQMTITDFFTLFPRQGATAGRGMATSGFGQAVSLTGSGAGKLSLQVPNMSVKSGANGVVFDRKNSYVDKITLEANLTDNADLFALGVVGGALI